MRWIRVVFWSQFYSAATSGRKVAERLRPLWGNFISIPCLPTVQSYAVLSCSKFTRRLTDTLRRGSSAIDIGSNLESLKALIIAYYGSTFSIDSVPLNVPMHPRRSSPSMCQVTNKGDLKIGKLGGYTGAFLLFNADWMMSKQKAQCSLVDRMASLDFIICCDCAVFCFYFEYFDYSAELAD